MKKIRVFFGVLLFGLLSSYHARADLSILSWDVEVKDGHFYGREALDIQYRLTGSEFLVAWEVYWYLVKDGNIVYTYTDRVNLSGYGSGLKYPSNPYDVWMELPKDLCILPGTYEVYGKVQGRLTGPKTVTLGSNFDIEPDYKYSSGQWTEEGFLTRATFDIKTFGGCEYYHIPMEFYYENESSGQKFTIRYETYPNISGNSTVTITEEFIWPNPPSGTWKLKGKVDPSNQIPEFKENNNITYTMFKRDYIIRPAISSISPTKGLPGSIVTVSGVDLDQVTSASFQGQNASIASQSSNQLRVIIPTTAMGSGPLQLSYSGGTVSSNQSFTVESSTRFTRTDVEGGDLPPGWLIYNSNLDAHRFEISSPGAGNTGSSLVMRNYDANTPGSIEGVLLPPMNTKDLDKLEIRFDAAYAYQTTKAPDDFIIFASFDGGNTFYSLLDIPASSIAVGTINAPWTPFDASHWPGFYYDLTPYLSSAPESITLIMGCRNQNNNNLWLDNITFYTEPYIWIGDNSSSWTQVDEWSTLPNASSSVLIPGDAAFRPNISSTVAVQSMIMDDGAQVQVSSSGDLTVSESLVMREGSRFRNYGNTSLDALSGEGASTVYLYDSLWVSGDISGDITFQGDDPLVLNGTTTQSVTIAAIDRLVIDNPADVQLANAMSIQDGLIFSQGKVLLGSHDLTLGGVVSLEGVSPTSYVVADGDGRVTRHVDGGDVFFPIGGATTFTPVALSNLGGTADDYSVKVSEYRLAEGDSGNHVATGSLPITWDVDEAVAGGSDVTVTLQWPQSIEPASFDSSRAYIDHFINGAWDSAAYAAVTPGDYAAYAKISRSGFSSFSPVGISYDTARASVAYVAIAAGPIASTTNEVQWVTASESNGDTFVVERSFDSLSFEIIGQVAAVGNSNVSQAYSYFDSTLTDACYGEVWYRVGLTFTNTSDTLQSGIANVESVDSIPPTILIQDLVRTLEVNGIVTITTAEVDNGSSDNCSIASMVLSDSIFTTADVGDNVVTLTVTDASGNVSSDTATITVLKRNQTITFSPIAARTYGDPDFDLSATSDAGLPVTYVSSDVSVATVSGSTVTIHGAGTTTITASQGGESIYNEAENVSKVLTVTPVALEITADAQTKIVGEVDPTLTYQLTSGALVGNDTLMGSLSREVGETAGSYAIEQGSLTAGSNYAITYLGATLTIQQVPRRYQDSDGDGYGNVSVSQVMAEAPVGYVADSTDCDDTNVLVQECGMLVGEWALDHCEGTTLTNSQNADGALVDGAWAAGYVEQNLILDGRDDYANLGSGAELTFTHSFTLAMWVNTTEVGPYKMILGKGLDGGRGYEFHIHNGKAAVYLGGNDTPGPYSSTTSVTDGNWHHVAATLNSVGDLSIYVDGVRERTVKVTGTLNANSNASVYLGARPDLLSYTAYRGALDEVRIYSGTLSDAEIASLAATTTAPQACGAPAGSLQASYTLDGCYTTVVTEGENGTADGALLNGADYVPGYNGQAISFDGVNDQAPLYDSAWSLGSNDAFTYSFWVYPRDISEFYQTMIYRHTGGGNGPIVQLHYGEPAIFLGGLDNAGQYFANTTLAQNTWNQVTITYEGGTLKFFVNGMLTNTVGGLTGNINWGTGYHSLGLFPGATNGYKFDGLLDEVRFFNVALSNEAAGEEYTRVSNDPSTCSPSSLAQWQFDDCASSTALDAIGSNHGFFNGAIRASGYTNAGVSFNGIDDYINVGTTSTLELDDEFTISLWVYPENSGLYKTVLAKGRDANYHGYYVQIHNGVPTMYLGGTIARSYFAGSSIPRNVWTHLAFTLKNGVWTSYINGVQSSQVANIQGTMVGATGTEFWMGMRPDVSDKLQYQGSLDEVAMYSVALDSVDISTLAGLAQNSTDCSSTREVLEVSDVFTPQAWHVYPNPNVGEFTVRLGDQIDPQEATLNLIDMSGRIYTLDTKQMSGNTIQVASKGLPAGIYVLRLQTPEGQYSQRMMIR